MSGPIVREPNRRDFAAIRSIYRREVERSPSSFELVAPSPAELEARYRSLAAAGYPYLVAEVDAVVVGYCYAAPYRDRPGYRYTVENSVYVDARYRGRGVGRALLTRLVERCESKGFRQMVAIIGGGSNRASIRLHEGAGFVRVGILRNVGWKLGAWQDTVIMQRGLGSAGAKAPTRG